MDVISTAGKLRQQLVVLESSDDNLQHLDGRLHELGGEYMKAEIEHSPFHMLQLTMRLSVCEGVHHMYKHYSNKQWAQVQTTARSIQSSLTADDSEQMTSPVTSPTPSTGSDRAAGVWTTMEREQFRRD